MRILILCLFLLVSYANAFYAYGSVSDNRLQSERNVLRFVKKLKWSLGVGVFDEPRNILDYKMSLGFRRVEYSYSDEKGTSRYVMDFDWMSWSVTYAPVYLEAFCGITYLLPKDNLLDYMDSRKSFEKLIDRVWVYPRYGFKLGFYVADDLMFALTANSSYVWWVYDKHYRRGNGTLLIDGIGVSVQYNFLN